MADDELVTRAKQGDEAAWRALYADHAGRLIAWLGLRPTGDTSMSPEDVASEAWYVAASKIGGFHGSSEEFAGWLFGIARRVAATAKRTAERRSTTPQECDDLTTVLDPTEDHALALERLAWVRSVLAPLSARERDAIGLVDVLGVDARIAAEVLGISGVALRVARHRGLRRLDRQALVLPLRLVNQPPDAAPQY
ncbi:RNA polymerase sigma factor [Nocardioides daejeonensis]|uniref:RNA polymerase sigma factor n=1 Tax=Nocardioides daejeonensis TaxID=1046556 RepID=UPI000D74F254|nr:RNA polymerase sigma factor [Nocardioides daejeonensis]